MTSFRRLTSGDSSRTAVPIYDARGVSFKVTEESIAKLSTLPRYMLGISDLNEYATVTVGYTANTYPYNYYANTSASALSLNIQFVIYHGFPEDESDEENDNDNAEGEEEEEEEEEE